MPLTSSIVMMSLLVLLTSLFPLTFASKNLITFCSESNGGGSCSTSSINDSALKGGFDIDGGELNRIMGFGPVSAKLETEGLICGLASEKRTDCNFLCITAQEHCQGDRVIVTSEKFVDLTGNLFQNAQCMGCFKSPGA
ncbi:hypothetical protein CC78DRAFT_567207 [Lojkania enalia]|uniref:Uncharacterized protein n=1 Tax=Lojkania enalia TaxID=147567 RepID=A0A9P4KGU6_9PLEO|nr:hypothetical protein CC78DRAFT_567207 [Didymosphaeria enalia]